MVDAGPSARSMTGPTVPKPTSNLRHGKPIFCPHGKTLGGSTSINGTVYTRGHRSDYDRLAELGNEGWGYDDVLGGL